MNHSGVDIEDFFLRGSETMTERDLDELRRLLPNLETKLNGIETGPVDELRPLVEFLRAYIEDGSADADFEPLREAGFALRYFLKGVDIIPDMLEDIGYADDLAILRLAVKRNHDALAEFAKLKGLDLPDPGKK